MSDDPRLSIVAASRNDDHGGNMLGRMQIFVDGVVEQSARHHLPVELLIVDWNPPTDRPRLADALGWPPANGACTVRVIEVPTGTHSRLAYSDRLPFFQMIAKNVAIRRATAPLVLATNVDILFSDELFLFLRNGSVERNRFYRIDRYDVPEDVVAEASISEQLEYCRENVIRVNRRNGTYDLRSGAFAPAVPPFRFIPRKLIDTAKRFLPRSLKHALYMGVTQKVFGRVPQRVAPEALHTNACGDFTLMSREAWFALRGYPEFEMFSFHLDSLLCYAAHYSGFKEVLLKEPLRIYHIEHSGGWAPETKETLNERLRKSEIPAIDDERLEEMVQAMKRGDLPLVFNDDGWGLADVDLPERQVLAVS